MTSNLLFLIAIVAILVANVAVVAAAAHREGRPWLPDRSARWLRARSGARRRDGVPGAPPDTDQGAPRDRVPGRAPNTDPQRATALDDVGPDDDLGPVDDRARTAAAIEAFVAGLDPNAGGPVAVPDPLPPADPEPALPLRPDQRREVGAGETAPGHAGPPAAQAGHPATWERLLGEEAARVARFGRPVTVVFAECPGLDRVAEQLGATAADRVAAELARLVLAEGRTTDRIVRLGAARFAALLIETDEPGALRYVERIRAAGDGWLAAAGLAARLAIGWASPDRGGDLGRAAETAQERMMARDSRPSTLGGPRGRPPAARSGTEATTRI